MADDLDPTTLDAIRAEVMTVERDGMTYVLVEDYASLRADLAAMTAERDCAKAYATNLAVALHGKHFADTAPDWRPVDDLMGLLTQIDNMSCALRKEPQK